MDPENHLTTSDYNEIVGAQTAAVQNLVTLADVRLLSEQLLLPFETVLGTIAAGAHQVAGQGQPAPLSAEEIVAYRRLERILEQATRVLGTEEKAARWIAHPRKIFSGRTPLSLLSTEDGARLVSDELGHLEYGDFA